MITALNLYSPVLMDDPTPSGYVWDWLANLLGDAAATAIQSVLMTVVYALTVYIIIIQVFRILNAVANKNAEDPKLRADATNVLKSSIFIVIAASAIGFGGFTALFFLMNKFFPASS